MLFFLNEARGEKPAADAIDTAAVHQKLNLEKKGLTAAAKTGVDVGHCPLGF
jgi:hypothetical protein